MDIPIHQRATLKELIRYIKHGVGNQVRMVLENQANFKIKKNMPALVQAAVEAGRKEVLITLLEHGLNVNVALDIVVNSGKDDLIELMLDRGADVNEGLYFAVKANKKDAIRFLLRRGANINTNQRNGYTPLHTALMQKICNVEIIEFLIKKGADTRVRTRTNKTVLDLFQKIIDGKHDAENKKKIENISILLNDNQNNKLFECTKGLPDVLIGYSYQIKLFTLFAIMNTKHAISSAYQYELSTKAKHLRVFPFDDIYFKKIQEGRTSYEFIQVKQTKIPNKISQSKYFAMLKPGCNVKEYMKGNDSIVNIFLKFNEIQESLLDIDASRVFIHYENTTFHDDSEPFLLRVDAIPNYGTQQWIIDKDFLFIEIKYVLLNLIKTSPSFSVINEEIKNIFENQIQIIKTLGKEDIYNKNYDKKLSSTKLIALKGINAIEEYLRLTYLPNYSRREFEKENLNRKGGNANKNLSDKLKLGYSDDEINEVYKSLINDKKLFSYFSKFEDVVIREKINNFVKQFSIYTGCPTSDELDEIIAKEISEEIAYDVPKIISSYCLQYFSRWSSNLKNAECSVFTDKDGKKLFYDTRMQIFHAINKSYIEKLERTELACRQNTEEVMNFLNKGNNCKILHVITPHTRLHAIKVFQSIENLRAQSTNLDYLNSIIYTSLEHVIKSEANLQNLFKVFNSHDSSDLLVLECTEDIEPQKASKVLDYLKNIETINERKKLIIIAKKENRLVTVLKVRTQKIMSYSETLSFKDLTRESQQFILKKPVNFANNPNSLRTQLKLENFITMSALEVMDECSLSTIVTNKESIQIGNQNAFTSDEYNVDTFIPRYLLNIDVNILQKCINNLFFITGIIKTKLIAKVSINEHSVHIWEKDKVYNKGIVLMPQSGNMTCKDIFGSLTSNNTYCYWLEFKGDLLYFNREDVCNNYDERIAQISKHHKLALENIEDKIVILASDAGEGKSTVLTHLAHCMRNKSINSWIIRVNLRNYEDNNLPDSLKDITFCVDDTSKTVEWITRIVVEVVSNNVNYQLERKLLKAVLNGYGTMDVILMFYGLDEISPAFKEKTCNLLKTLVKTNIKQMWVTTRAQLKEYLEQEFGVPSRMLAGFSESEQIHFMCKYWKWQLNHHNLSHMLTEVEQTLEIMKQLRMLFNNLKGSVIYEHYEDLLKYLKKCSLLELQKFINHEIDFYKLAKGLLEVWKNPKETYAFLKTPLHIEMFAKNLIQREWEYEICPNSFLFRMYTDFVQTKLDILVYDERRTNNINQYANDYADIKKEVLKKNLHEIAVRTFLSTIPILPDLNICSEYPNFLENLARAGLVKYYGSRVDFVHRTFAEYFFSEYLVTHLDHPDVQTECLEKILFYDDYHLVRIFFDEFLYESHNTAAHGKTFEKILKPSVMDKIIKLRNTNENVLHIAVRGGHVQIFLLILKNISEIMFAELVMESSREGYSMLQLSINTGNTAMSNTIINSVKEFKINSPFNISMQTPSKNIWDTIKKYSSQVSATALLRIHQGTVQNVPTNKYMDTITGSLLDDLLLKSDNNERTALHIAAELGQSCVYKSIISAAKESNVFKQIILHVDSYKKSALHYAVLSNNREFIQVIIESTEDHFDIFKELIRLVDKNGQNVLHIAAKFNGIDAYDIIIKSIEKYEGMLKHLITQCDIYNENTLDLAVSYRSIDICKLLLETAEKYDYLKELLMKRNINEKTILHLAAEMCDQPLCSLILNTVKAHEDLIKYLITQKDLNGQTALHIATHVKEAGICDVILKMIKNGAEDLKTVLMLRDNQKRTALEMAVKSNNRSICQLVLNYAVKHEVVFRDVIMQCDENRERTVLHLAAIYGYNRICSIILNTAKIHRKVLKNLILQCDKYGYTALELAKNKSFKEFLKYKNLNIDSITELARYKNNKEFSDVFIATILQSHYALRIWLSRIKSKVRVIHKDSYKKIRSKYLLSPRLSELNGLYSVVLNRQNIIYNCISK